MATGSCYNWDFYTSQPALADSRYDQPCPSGNGCCDPGDTCVGNFMCKHAQAATDPNRPDYYIGACTDSTYSESACVKFCAKFVRTGVVYNSTSGLWACCGTADPPTNNLTTLCATPSHETFNLVPPNALPVIGIAGGGASSSSSSTSTSASTTTSMSNTSSVTSSATISSSPESDSAGGGGMSTGAQVGLGVGLGVGIALLVAAAAFVFIRRRRNARSRAAMQVDQPMTKPEPFKAESHYAPTTKDAPPAYMSHKKGSSRQQLFPVGNTHELQEFHSELPEHGTARRVELP